MATPQRPDRPDPAALLVERLRAGGPAVVALSGGVDSSVVAALAVTALGARASAVTLTGPAVSRKEVDRAQAVARGLGIDHHLLSVDPLAVVEYRSNPSNRCYFCRRTEMGAIVQWSRGRGIGQFLDGVHADDLGDDRPGLRAMDEAGFTHPLITAGWGKREVRAYAREVGLPNAEAPSDACLASRVRHGQAISAELLGRVERAEAFVRGLGFDRVRVRTDGGAARVEVDVPEVARLLATSTAREVQGALRALGFSDVSLDPLGYRTLARRD